MNNFTYKKIDDDGLMNFFFVQFKNPRQPTDRHRQGILLSSSIGNL